MEKDLLGEPLAPASSDKSSDIALSPANSAFEEFWQTKPKREGDNPKAKARELFLKLVAAGVKIDTILGATRQWAELVRKEGDEGKRFVPMAVTWLNQQRFDGYVPLNPIKTEEIAAQAALLGWQWDGEKWVRDPDAPPPEPRRFTPARAFTVEDRATLFVSRETPFYAGMVERHEASDKKNSYYGKSLDRERDGIWVTPDWYVPGRVTGRLQMHQLMPPAKEITSPDFSQPFASALPPEHHPIDMDGPPLEAYADALSMEEAGEDIR